MLKKYELLDNVYLLKKKRMQKNKIDFISSVFDEESYDFLSQKLNRK